MRSRMMLSMLVIAMVAAVIGGATMAGFFYKVEVTNTFTMGTVEITADDSDYFTMDFTNVNPGDCLMKYIEVCNTGSKAITVDFDVLLVEIELDDARITGHWDGLCFNEVDVPEGDIEALLNELFGVDGWYKEEGVYYVTAETYVDAVDVGFEYWVDGDGNYVPEPELAAKECATAKFKVCFPKETFGKNIFQGAEFNITFRVIGNQASHQDL